MNAFSGAIKNILVMIIASSDGGSLPKSIYLADLRWVFFVYNTTNLKPLKRKL